MLFDVPPAARESLRPLFARFPGLHGVVDAALGGEMGRVRADNHASATLAVIELDFVLLAGNAGSPAAEEAVQGMSVPWSAVASGADWESLLRRVWGDTLRTRRRVAFRPANWDRRRLEQFKHALPDGFTLGRVGMEDAADFAQLADSLVYNYPSLKEFVARGVGFGVRHQGRYVSGCSSFALSSCSLEIEIQTHLDFRNRGLASASAAAMIEHCMDHALKPCWDAHNEVSAALAEKLGFVRPTPYTAYEAGEDEAPAEEGSVEREYREV